MENLPSHPVEPPHDVASAMAALRRARPDLRLDLRWHDEVSSTMDVASRLADAGALAGVVVAAAAQTAGRGRRGHAWSSPAAAGLYVTYLARPTRDAGLVTLAAGVGVRRGVLAATGLETHLKWPNDVMVGRRKLAGILTEGAHLGTADAAVLVGVGINLRHASHPADVAARATSIEEALGHVVERGAVLAATLADLADALSSLERGGGPGILAAWREAAPTARGARVAWCDDGGIRSGQTMGIDESGALLVQTAAGLERVVAGGLDWSW